MYSLNVRKTVFIERNEVICLKRDYDYSYLRGFIQEHFGTNQKFAEFLGIGTTALYDRLANRSPFTQDEIDKVAHEATGRVLDGSDINRLFFERKIRKSV